MTMLTCGGTPSGTAVHHAARDCAVPTIDAPPEDPARYQPAYLPPRTATRSHPVPPRRAQRAACCPRSRSACGTTSATTSRSRPSGRSCAAPSTSASPTSTWPTTTGRPTARPRRTSAGSSREDFRPYRDELVISTKAGYDMWPGPYGDGGSRKYLLGSPRPVAGPDGPGLRRHLLLATGPTRTRRWRRRWARWTPRCAPGGRCTPASRPTPPERTARGGRDPARARHAAADPPAVVLDAQPLGRGRQPRCSTCWRSEGVGCIAFSPLAQGMLTDRYLDGIPADSRAAQGKSLDPDLLTDEALDARPGAERDRRGARPVAGPARAGLGAARPAGDLGADRREQRRAARGQPRRASTARTSTDDELAAIDQHAVDSGINLWAQSSAG